MNQNDTPQLEAYKTYLIAEEKSAATIDKYLRDVRIFCAFAGEAAVTKEVVIRYKERLQGEYAVASANSMIAAVNHYLAYIGLAACKVKQFKCQRKAFCDSNQELTREEYLRLIQAAHGTGNERLSLVLQTLCATGIRVSELPFVTVEAVRKGRATVTLKGKTREVLLPGKLCKRLLEYINKADITNGAVFLTRTCRPLDRSYIWKSMKDLCKIAGVDPKKVYPHNLRHLFARCYYEQQKDIVKLADVMGHSNIETTRTYLVSTGIQHERTLNRLGLVA